jgi:hypothetical protein
MRRELFFRIVKACEANITYFRRRRDAVGVLGFSMYQNISVAMRVLAYGIPTNYCDEYLHIGEDTTIEYVQRFAKVVIWLFC